MKIKLEGILLFILIAYGVLKTSLGISLITSFCMILGVFLLLWSIYLKSHLTQIKIILALSFLGIDYLLFCMPLILMPKIFIRKKYIISKSLMFFIITFLYVLFITIIVNFIDFSILSTLLGVLLFLAPILPFLYFSQFSYEEEELVLIFDFFKKLILIQIPIIIIQYYLSINKQGDDLKGSLESSDKLGFFIIIYAIFLTIPYFLTKDLRLKKLLSLKTIFSILALCVILIFADAKVVYLCVFFGLLSTFLFYFLLKLFIKLRKLSKSKLFLFSGIILITGFSLPIFINIYLRVVFNIKEDRVMEIVKKYVDDPKSSQKYTFYKRVFNTMAVKEPVVWAIGTGFGKCGGRASNTFAYDILYKTPDKKLPSFIPSYSSQWVKKYMYDLYTKEVYDQIRWKSTNMSSPFSGIITIKAEYGIIGFVLYLVSFIYLFISLVIRLNFFHTIYIRAWAIVLSIYILSILFLMLFDNYQEFPQIMIPLFIFSALFFSKEKKNL